MEEQKNKEEKKLSYEQLEDVANQLSIQLQKAKYQLTQVTNVVGKLPYLFKVVELGTVTFEEAFVQECKKEIIEIMTPTEESKEENKDAEA